MSESRGELGITAVYTSQVAVWGRLPHADLFDGGPGRVVFWLTNLFVGVGALFRRRAPSLAVSILHRQVMFDRLVQRERPRAVVELAAGLSRRGALLSEDAALEVVEVDVPEVVRVKEELLARSPAGRRVLERPNLRRVGLDLARPALDEDPLRGLTPSGRPLVVTAEGLCMYLEADAQRRLWTRVRDLLDGGGGGAFVFDLVPATEQGEAGWVGRMLGRLMAAFTGGRGFVRDGRDRAAILAELGACGFDRIELFEPAQVAVGWDLPHPERHSQQLVFLARCGRREIRPGEDSGDLAPGQTGSV